MVVGVEPQTGTVPVDVARKNRPSGTRHVVRITYLAREELREPDVGGCTSGDRSDVEHLIRMRMRERGVSFKRALNDAIRAGLAEPPGRTEFTTRTAALGTPTVNLDRALQLVGELEDDELIRRMRTGS